MFLVDDHVLFRGGLKGLLTVGGICEVVGEAGDGVEFLELLSASGAGIVLMDIDMPRMNGMEAAQKALEIAPDLKIITLSMHGDEDYYFRMVAIGVKGFLLKSSDINEVKAAIEAVAEGGSYFSQELLRSLVGSLKAANHRASNPGLATDGTGSGANNGERSGVYNVTNNGADNGADNYADNGENIVGNDGEYDNENAVFAPGQELSMRELEILVLICQGLSNQEIADRLFISKRTVDKHRANILDKTGCRNTANLVMYAIRNSLVEI